MSANKTNFSLLTAFIFILFGLFYLFIKTIPLTLAHAIYFCQRTFSNAIVFSSNAPLFALLIFSFIFSIGLIILTVQIIKTGMLIKATLKKRIPHPKKLLSFAENLGLQNKINVIEDRNQFSFCYGLLRPRICISTGLIESLEENELKAVLLHESYHLKNHDPLRIILGKTSSRMLFFIPTFKDIQSHYAFSKEIAADEVAIRSGHKEFLISALTKLLSPSIPSLSGVAAFADSHSLENRILYLTEQKKVSIRLSKRNLLLSFSAILFLFILLSGPVHAIATNDKAMSHSYFICPFGGDCINSCKKELTQSTKNNFSKNLHYTPVK